MSRDSGRCLIRLIVSSPEAFVCKVLLVLQRNPIHSLVSHRQYFNFPQNEKQVCLTTTGKKWRRPGLSQMLTTCCRSLGKSIVKPDPEFKL